ncbi:hypothetical protein [uncultured Cocleimonas sp.]|uniref:hypothetical protein n=1 Tax=uncultured Cocleimonas sp. TaxID=1051587 RepID=UPI002629C8CF|nr:hypothetical protein [uncultured Cocleimonas sp.]
MNSKIYFFMKSIMLSKIFKISKISIFTVYTLFFVISNSFNIAYANRFDAPSLKLPLNEFDSRIDSSIFNVDFLLAHIINNGRKTVREVGEITDTVEGLLQDTTVFTNNSGVEGASAGSVIIPPGTTANTIIILNQNEGDSIAIQR